MEFVDTHCHIHLDDYKLDAGAVIEAARAAGVTRLLCVGTTLKDSQAGVKFVQARKGAWASVGLHPHEASRYAGSPAKLTEFAALLSQESSRTSIKTRKIVAVGECGLDYYYQHSPKADQETVFRFQIELALEHGLPMIFHVRDAFPDFWRILDDYKGIKGVVHSFSATTKEVDEIVSRGLYAGLNGIMTFTRDASQLDAAKAIPLENLLLETDAPYLTPVPFRGTICEPKHVVLTAEFLAGLFKVPVTEVAASTTNNAINLFKLK